MRYLTKEYPKDQVLAFFFDKELMQPTQLSFVQEFINQNIGFVRMLHHLSVFPICFGESLLCQSSFILQRDTNDGKR